MAVVQRWMLLSCVLDIYIHILISGTLVIHHVCWISTFISQIHQQYIMCTGYLHSYPYLRYISSTACVLLSTFISISQVHQQYSTVIYIPIHISGTLAVNHVYWISTFISISQVHQQYIMCTEYLHSYPYLRYISSSSCVLDIYIRSHVYISSTSCVLDFFISIFYVTIGNTSCVLYTEKGQSIFLSVYLYIFISISYSPFTHSEYTNY